MSRVTAGNEVCIGLEASLAGNPRVLIPAAREMEREVSLNRGVVIRLRLQHNVLLSLTHTSAHAHTCIHTPLLHLGKLLLIQSPQLSSIWKRLSLSLMAASAHSLWPPTVAGLSLTLASAQARLLGALVMLCSQPSLLPFA